LKKILPIDDLINIYKKGFFPMAESKQSNKVIFYKPKKRFIIPINEFHVPKKLFRLFKKSQYIFKINFDFERVIFNCQNTNRKSNGTWINNIILDTYIQLFKANKCHSVECYDRNNLVGGLYGLQIGGCFFGESMFSMRSNTSKYCLLFLIAILKKNSFNILDSQFYNSHLTQFGAYEIETENYMQKLKKSIEKKCNFKSLKNFQEALSLIHPTSHKS
tara:strand:- start:2086 stop:2739 length:654 start_codon:yes stop_codon:yes gene_type:complete